MREELHEQMSRLDRCRKCPTRTVVLLASKMTHCKRASHTRHSTPAQLALQIYAHTYPIRSDPHYRRCNDIKQKHSRKLHGHEDDSEGTYPSFLRAICDTKDEDCASNPDGIDVDASSGDQEWDEEATLIEMLGSPYSNLSHF